MAGQIGQSLLVNVPELGALLDIQLPPFQHGFGDVVDFSDAMQAGNRDDGVGVQNVADGQAGALVVLFGLASEERTGGERLDPERSDIMLLESLKDEKTMPACRPCAITCASPLTGSPSPGATLTER